ncbi:MAG: sulfotransferase family 2 domain-containing protein [Pseudomonadota bacterium]
MLLSPRYKFLFVHIAKTGGTSVRAALERVRRRDPWYWLMWPCHRMSHLTGHRLGTKFPRHAHAIAAQEMLPKDFYDSLFKFAFVRNPWDLQVSSFHHIRRERPHYMEGRDNFADFLRWKLDPARPYQFHIDTSIELQSDYLIDLHDHLIVDFVGRYERLHEDFAEACRRIGIAGPELPHRRQATDRRRDYREYYDDATADLVARHFARDIDRFGYRFDDPAGD